MRAAHRVRRAPERVAPLIAGSVYVAVAVVVAAVAAWPVYASLSYVVLVVVASLAGAGIAVLATLRRWGGWLVTALLAGVFLLFSVPLAVPSRMSGPLDVLRGLGEAFAGLLLGWKDLVTVELPVGSYRNLLVPALVVFLVGTCAALLLAWRADRRSAGAVVVGLAMAGFGLFFGRTSVSAPLTLGPITLFAPVETLLGILGLVSALLWLAWRTHDDRVQSLERAGVASGVRVSRRPSRTDRRRTVLGAGMVVLALAASLAVVPWAASGLDRTVLRSAAGPERDIARAVSPLSDYRALFGDDSDEVLFRVSGDALPERVRLATLDVYDGEVFRPGGEDADTTAPFVRVPATLDAGEGAEVEASVEIGALDGIWMPTAGRLRAVQFEGERAAALDDGFYYSAAAQAGVQTAGDGLAAGDAFEIDAVEPPVVELATLRAPGTDAGGVEAPENLRQWVERHAPTRDGAGLAAAVTLLRDRGFLSHALTIDEAAPPSWVAELGDYGFQPSASGHSLARIDAMFARLLEREGDPRAAQNDNYVAAIGDDEQFAVATALIARELGFPARVVVGARLFSADPDLAVCDDGECRAQDLTAWTEVRSDDGTWVPVDVTPQWAQSPSLEVTEQRDPENVTEVRPDTVEEVVPPAPVQEDSARDEDDETDAGLDLAWLWPVLRIAGLVLLVLAVVLGPFLVILGAKALRRRARRRAEQPAERIIGGWDEYVDAGVDAGREAPRILTRSELADAYATPAGAQLAAVADRVVFSGASATADEAEEFWRIVDHERRGLQRGRGAWRTIVAAVSLRSFVRLLSPHTPARVPRFVERGRRRSSRSGRTTS